MQNIVKVQLLRHHNAPNVWLDVWLELDNKKRGKTHYTYLATDIEAAVRTFKNFAAQPIVPAAINEKNYSFIIVPFITVKKVKSTAQQQTLKTLVKINKYAELHTHIFTLVISCVVPSATRNSRTYSLAVQYKSTPLVVYINRRCVDLCMHCVHGLHKLMNHARCPETACISAMVTLTPVIGEEEADQP